jgi:hypothetical protein
MDPPYRPRFPLVEAVRAARQNDRKRRSLYRLMKSRLPVRSRSPAWLRTWHWGCRLRIAAARVVRLRYGPTKSATVLSCDTMWSIVFRSFISEVPHFLLAWSIVMRLGSDDGEDGFSDLVGPTYGSRQLDMAPQLAVHRHRCGQALVGRPLVLSPVPLSSDAVGKGVMRHEAAPMYAAGSFLLLTSQPGLESPREGATDLGS